MSLVVIARNEADRIADCLDSVPFASEKLVLDSGSEDDTVAIAESRGARVIRTDWPGFVAQKNRALAEAKGPWVLSLDADERLSPRACTEVREVVGSAAGESSAAAGFSFPRCSRWLGTELRYGTWYPDRRVRLVRKNQAQWAGEDPHDRLAVDGAVRSLSGDILHTPYRDLSEHLATIDRYTLLHAQSLHKKGVRARRSDVVLRPPLHFVKALLLKRGFLDGLPGFAVATLGMTYVLCKWWRLWTLQRASETQGNP